jgi:hypothetical protein
MVRVVAAVVPSGGKKCNACRPRGGLTPPIGFNASERYACQRAAVNAFERVSMEFIGFLVGGRTA